MLKLPQGERWFDMSVASMATIQDADQCFKRDIAPDTKSPDWYFGSMKLDYPEAGTDGCPLTRQT